MSRTQSNTKGSKSRTRKRKLTGRRMKYRECLKSIRKRAGVSADECAKALGFKWGTGYSRYENSSAFDDVAIPAKIIEGIIPLFVGKGYPKVTENELWEISDLPKSRQTPPAGPAMAAATGNLRDLAHLYPNLAPGTLVEAVHEGEIVKARVYRFDGRQYEMTPDRGGDLFTGLIVAVPTMRKNP